MYKEITAFRNYLCGWILIIRTLYSETHIRTRHTINVSALLVEDWQDFSWKDCAVYKRSCADF